MLLQFPVASSLRPEEIMMMMMMMILCLCVYDLMMMMMIVDDDDDDDDDATVAFIVDPSAGGSYLISCGQRIVITMRLCWPCPTPYLGSTKTRNKNYRPKASCNASASCIFATDPT